MNTFILMLACAVLTCVFVAVIIVETVIDAVRDMIKRENAAWLREFDEHYLSKLD
jgi:type II secretory pathway component PulK